MSDLSHEGRHSLGWLGELTYVCLVEAPVLEADRKAQTGNLDSRLIKGQVRILADLHILEGG